MSQLLVACRVQPTPAENSLQATEPEATRQPSLTVQASLTETQAPTLSITPTITLKNSPTPVSPTVTPQPLEAFLPRLPTGIEPVRYIQNTCEYLQKRWNPKNAQPGTVVVPVMYHGVRKAGGEVSDNNTVTQQYFEETMAYAQKSGFETITSEQLVAFLHHNAYIPPRSLYLIIDDRRLGTVRNHFLPVLEKNNWTLVMAYITGIINAREWQQIKQVLASGRVEIQAHGYMHNGQTYFTEHTPDEIIHQEIYEPISAFEENLGYRPYVFVWPGGNFTPKTVAEAEKAGYKLGFTVYARGPLMFNWIPQGEPERATENPLLVLPRYWSTALGINIDQAISFGNQAADFAAANRQKELAWYAAYCRDYERISGLSSELAWGKSQ